LTYYNFFIF